MNPSDEENQSQGPVIRDRRRIDPKTGQVRDIPGQAKPGKHSAAQQSGQHPAPAQSAAQGARAPGGGVPGGGGSSTNTTRAGWVVGGGAEYAFTHNWSVKAEYLYSRFSGVGVAGLVIPGPASPPIALTGTASQSIQIARAGLDYHF